MNVSFKEEAKIARSANE